MGPRLGGRGDGSGRAATGATRTCFNGAAARWPRRCHEDLKYHCRGCDRLQWGRGSVAAEISSRCWRRSGGPSGFNGAAARWPRRSVRPRLLSAACLPGLQWGRGSVAAEMDHETTETILPTLASMGPRLGGRGDLSKNIAIVTCEGCFNGAAARWPRRCYQQGQLSKARWLCFNGAAARWPRR